MTATGATDIGMQRKQNQDDFRVELHYELDQALLMVCDGMGGARAGDIASEMAADLFSDSFSRRRKPGMSLDYMHAVMLEALTETNSVIYRKSCEDVNCSGMGTTIVAASIDGDDAMIMNVGDSRAYIIRGEKIERITNDHSVAEEMVRRGELTPEQAKTYPAKNYITRAVGTSDTAEPEFYTVSLLEEDHILLCSDGLTNMLDDEEILSVVKSCTDVSECCNELILMANRQGGTDNITVVLYHHKMM